MSSTYNVESKLEEKSKSLICKKNNKAKTRFLLACIKCSADCSFVPQLQSAVEVIPYLCVSEQNRPTPDPRRLSLTRAGLKKLIFVSIGRTFLINAWRLEAFSRHSMLHLYSVHRAALVPDWVRSFSSSNAAGTNRCLDLSSWNFTSRIMVTSACFWSGKRIDTRLR